MGHEGGGSNENENVNEKGFWGLDNKCEGESLYLYTNVFYKIARIAKILNEIQWRLGATDIWKG